MSKTNVKNGSKVWDAFMFLVPDDRIRHVPFASTAAIASRAGVSKPTVRKYMTMAQEAGHCRKEQIYGRMELWIREA